MGYGWSCDDEGEIMVKCKGCEMELSLDEYYEFIARCFNVSCPKRNEPQSLLEYI